MLLHSATRQNGLRFLEDIITDLFAIARRIRAQTGVYEQQEDRRASLLRDAADQLDVIISRLEGRL
jgi:citrate synthase